MAQECGLSSPLGCLEGRAMIGPQRAVPLIQTIAAMSVVRRGTMPMIVTVTAGGIEAGNPFCIPGL